MRTMHNRPMAHWVHVVFAVLATASAISAPCRAQSASPTSPRPAQSTTGPARSAPQPAGEVYREIDDPYTGDRWLIVRDEASPAGPGYLVRIESPASDAKKIGSSNAAQGAEPLNAARMQPVIHAGEVLIVEEHTPIVDSRLTAIALGPAAAGAEFKARLKIGGKVVHVIALEAAHAELAPESEAQK